MDVKPSNILLGPGDAPLVTDVGYSTTRGTPAYMSPEQCQLQKPTSASDQYALAVMSYLLLVGRLPFTGDTNKLLRQHVYTAPPPPPVPTEVERVLLTGLAKSPRDRFPSISALAFKLEQAIGGARWDIQHGAPSDDRTLEAITLDSESAPELARRA
jgi:serine/threonine protein kinase